MIRNTPLYAYEIWGDNTFPFQGLIDEVGIYNRALTATEVQSIFDAGKGGKCKPLFTNQTVIPTQSTDYKYHVYALGGVPGDFGAENFDDSASSIGNAAFGTGGGCHLSSTVRTSWPSSSEIVLRKVFTLPTGARNLKVLAAIDNDVQVFLNGVDISGGLVNHDGCANFDELFSAPDAILRIGQNLLAVRGRDRGGEGFLDLQVTADLPTTSSDIVSFTLSPTIVTGGQTSTGTVILQTPAPLGGATIALSSSNSNVATVPPGVSVAERSTSTTFTVNTNIVNSDSLVDISASYQGQTRSATLHVTAPRPDLQVTSINAPATATTDSSFDLSWTVANNGGAQANGPWTDKVYLSTDDHPGNDTLLAEFPFSQSLDTGQSATRTQVISVPRAAVPSDGQYFFIVVTDANNNVDEGTNENNNDRAIPININRTVRPDLIVQSIQAPDTAFFGQTINVHWTVKNSGGGSTDASEWTDRVYLSSDQSIGNAAVRLDVLNVSYLNAGESYVASADLKIPRGLFNTFHIIVTTDVGSAVAEDNKTNNSLDRTISLQVPPVPDLQVTLVQGPTQGFPGEPLLLNYRVENRGDGETPQNESSWTDSIYMSPTQTFNPGAARLLGTQSHSGSLAPNAGYTVSGLSLNLPHDIIGDWYLFVVADTANNVYEFVNENNNSNLDQNHAMHVQATPPDLIVQAIATPGSANAGNPITISWGVRNQGAFDAAPGWFDTVYLTNNSTPNPSTDTPLTTVFHSSPLGPGMNYDASASVSLPNCASGTSYVYVVTDSRNQIFEFDPNLDAEQNNRSELRPLQVSLVPPDLHVTAIGNPSNGDAGQPVPISWTVTNGGAGPTREGTWSDAVYLSTTPNFNASSSVLIGTFTHSGDLGVNASYSQTVNVGLPTTAEGLYYIFVLTDLNGNVVECAVRTTTLAQG